MTEEKQVESLGNVLDLMDRVNETFAYGIWVPSLNKEVMFREIVKIIIHISFVV